MTIRLDTDQEQICHGCSEPIEGPMLVYGTKIERDHRLAVLLDIYHPHCDPELFIQPTL